MAATRAATCLLPLLPPKVSTTSRDDNRQMCREKKRGSLIMHALSQPDRQLLMVIELTVSSRDVVVTYRGRRHVAAQVAAIVLSLSGFLSC